MKLFVWMIHEIFKMLNQYAVDIPTLPVNQCLYHLIQFLVECWAVLWECLAAKMGRPSIWDTWYIGKRVCKSGRVFYSTLSAGIESMEFSHVGTSPHVMTESQTPVQDRAVQDRQPKIQSSSVEETLQRIMVQTNNDCRFRIFISTSSPRQLVGRKDSRLRYVLDHNLFQKLCCGSKKWRWLIQCMISNLRVPSEGLQVQILSYSTRELLQHWTESSRIPASRERSVWRNLRPKKKTASRGRQIAYLIYEYFRVNGANDSVENYADLFTVGLRNDDVQEFDSMWDGILLSMTKIPPDDILEGLDKLRIRESEKLKTVLELYDLENHQKKAGPDYHRLKTMVERSIEHGQESGNKTACTKNSWRLLAMENQRAVCERRQLQFPKRYQKACKIDTVESFSEFFMHQNERNASRTRWPRGKSPSGRTSRWPCKDYLMGTCTNSFREKWHPPECLFYKTEKGCRFGEKCSYAHRQVDEQPSKRSKKEWWQKCSIYVSCMIERGNPLFVVTHVTRKATDLLCAVHRIHDNWVASFRIWSRRSCHQFYGRVQTCRNQSNV